MRSARSLPRAAPRALALAATPAARGEALADVDALAGGGAGRSSRQ
jgi:hypothetical protein